MKNQDKYRGCLIGGAAGDALGYAVEFSSAKYIFSRYGQRGITEYALVNRVGQISDDTQMTLFTANGLLVGTTRGQSGSYPYYIHQAYLDWLGTQRGEGLEPEKVSFCSTWLFRVPALNHPRAPGNTCLDALSSGKMGSIAEPINNSKGCGGVMRVAPIGLYLGHRPELTSDEVDWIGAEAAAITHGHPLGYLPAAMLVHIINLVSHSQDWSLEDAVKDAIRAVKQQFPQSKELAQLVKLTEKAIRLAHSDLEDLDAIRQLGEGWVAEETLAIAVYCALKYQDDFDAALIASVNHDGDSDSTGAVTGNILGAYLGLQGIPEKYLTNLELKEVVLELADDLYQDCPIIGGDYDAHPLWAKKYIYNDYRRWS